MNASSLVLVGALYLAIAGAPGMALAQSAVSASSTFGYPGTVSTVPVGQSHATNVVAVQFDLRFDPAKVTAGEARADNLPNNFFVRSRVLGPGLERVVVYSLDNLPLPPVRSRLARQPFTVAAAEHVSSGPLTPTNLGLARLDGFNVSPVLGQPGEIFIQPVHLRSNGVADFFFAVTPGTNYTVEATTNFVHWTPLTNVVAPASFLDLVDPDAPLFPYRFYRWSR